jgi:hypothetical protein
LRLERHRLTTCATGGRGTEERHSEGLPLELKLAVLLLFRLWLCRRLAVAPEALGSGVGTPRL